VSFTRWLREAWDYCRGKPCAECGRTKDVDGSALIVARPRHSRRYRCYRCSVPAQQEIAA
jgi:hypothetical protein